MNEKLIVITTGGTLDSYYHPHNCTTEPFKTSEVSKYLSNYEYDFSYENVCSKNSEEINEYDKLRIAEIIDKSPYNKFIIVHGTVTLRETSDFLDKYIERKDATVILVGSYYPLQYSSYDSDALFNLGVSVASSLLLKHGVYFTIKGKVFDSNDDSTDIH